jgi:hypothetical protein
MNLAVASDGSAHSPGYIRALDQRSNRSALIVTPSRNFATLALDRFKWLLQDGSIIGARVLASDVLTKPRLRF